MSKGCSSLIPYLIIKGASEAIHCYKNAFDATEQMRFTSSSGEILHAEILINNAVIMLADEFPHMGYVSPSTLGNTSISLHLYVEDVDQVYQKAIAAGCTVEKPLQNQFFGERSATLLDPFGHRWSIATKIEEVSPEEIRRRFEAMMKST